MKKRIALCLSWIWILLSVCVPASGAEQLVLPAEPSEQSDELAIRLLDLGSTVDAQGFAQLCEEAGFQVRLQKHFEKSGEDPSHNCAFTIAEGNVLRGSEMCPALLVTIRGTVDGEWYSNFDFCPSHSEEPAFAENFLFCAEDVFLSLKEFLDAKDPSVPVIITGISRGAACAGLLGLLVNEYDTADHVYVYTFACPNVIGVSHDIPESDNIFNYINPADLVPKVPLSEWGFTRPGTDVILPQDDALLKEASEQYALAIYEIAPSIMDYYTVRHSLTQPGEDPLGLTSFELMMLLSSQVIAQSNHVIYEDGNLVWQGSPQFSPGIPDTFRDSDFSKLIDPPDTVFQGHNEKLFTLLLQHMPSSYRQLLQKLVSDAEQLPS